MLVLALYLGVMVAGGIARSVLKSFGIDGFWGIFFAILVALPIDNGIRYGLG